MSMTKTERTELRRIIKNRFGHLREQIAMRESQIAAQMKEEIMSEHADKISEYEKRAQAIADKAAACQQELRLLGEEALKDGLRPKYTHDRVINVYNYDLTYSVDNIDRTIFNHLKKVREESGLAQLDLAAEQIALDEELAIGSLESEDARSFLDRVPNIDRLLPLPEGRKALKA